MGKLVLFCILLLASFNSDKIPQGGQNLVSVLWIFWIGWVLFIHNDKKEEKPKKKRKFYLDEDD